MIPFINIPINFPTSTTTAIIRAAKTVPEVPFYSQLKDIKPLEWRKIGCGVASLAMLIEFYKPETVSINKLLEQAIDSGAYLQNAGWKHKDLALLANSYGLEGKNYDLSGYDKNTAFIKFKDSLKDGPVMASVYYKFDPKSTIPHLVVINGIDSDTIYYNDPAGDGAGKKISTANFLKAWKKRFIVIRPTDKNLDKILANK